MSELVQIKRYIDFEKGKAPKETFDSPSNGHVPYLSPEYLRGTGNPIYVKPNWRLVNIDEGELIILWDGSNAGEVFISKKGILASTMTKIIIDENEFDKSYFSFALKYNEYLLKAKTAGSGIPHVDKGIIKKIVVFKPSKPEQRTIASILIKVDQAINITKKNIAKAERLKKALMQNLLIGTLKPDGSWRREDEFYKDEKFGNTPNGWHWGRLSEIADIIAGQSPAGEFYNEDGLGVPMLNGPTEFTDLHPIPIQYTTKTTKLCEVGDILFTVRGSSTGRMNIADQRYCIGRGIAAIRNKESCDINFIYYTLITIAEKILAEARGSGTTFPNVNRGEMMKKWVLIPADEQGAIASKIKSIDEILKFKGIKVKKLECLKKALMQNLLTGKVRVKV